MTSAPADPAAAAHGAGADFSGLVPGDPSDAALLAAVRPSDWRNPEPRGKYDLAVLGGGTAGLVTAAIAAGLGARVALVERALLGGDCLNVGCVPSKALLRAGAAWQAARGAAAFGGPPADGDGDFGTAMQRMRRVRAGLSEVDSARRFAGLGVDVFLAEGRFAAPDRLIVGDAELPFRRAVIAAGARPAVPPIPGLAGARPLTNETVFGLTSLPARLVVIGGGPIGCELAQAFARFGASVTLLDAAPRLLGGDDPDAAGIVGAALERDGVQVRLGVTVEHVERVDGLVRVRLAGGGLPIEADEILVAAGRRPNIETLGLDAAAVETTARGITVDDRFRTTSRRIYAIGDVLGGRQFTHLADAQARLVVPNALFFGLGGGRASSLVVPWCTYTDPEVAHTGATAAELEARGVAFDTITVPLEHVDRAVIDGTTEGFARVHLARGSDRVLGGTIVAPHAGESITALTLTIRRGLGLGALGATIHPYPTVAEALRKAADAHRRGRLSAGARRALAAYFDLFRLGVR